MQMLDNAVRRARRWYRYLASWLRTMTWIELMLTAVILALLVFGIVAGIAERDAKDRCRDNGGTVVEHSCRTVLILMSCGDNCSMFVPVERCEWRCEGASAEDGR